MRQKKTSDLNMKISKTRISLVHLVSEVMAFAVLRQGGRQEVSQR